MQLIFAIFTCLIVGVGKNIFFPDRDEKRTIGRRIGKNRAVPHQETGISG
jgi:hypothetical protein